MNYNKKWLILILALSAIYSFSQTKPRDLPNLPPPGNIKLLPNYTFERKQGIDSSVGTFSKKDGLSIGYDIGRMAGNYVKSVYSREKQNTVWLKTQIINGQELTLLYLKNGKIYASFKDSYANFFADVKNDEELTDFLLIVSTYDSKEDQENTKTNK